MKIGTILKVSDEGLKAFYPVKTENLWRRQHMEGERFIFVRIDPEDSRLLQVQRIDTKSHRLETWHEDFMEEVK